MKNIILFVSILMVCAITASGQEKNHEIEVNIGIGDDVKFGDVLLLYLEGTYGVKATPWFVVGAGLKMTHFGFEEFIPHVMPLFAQLKFIKRNRKVSPYITQHLGYAIPIRDDGGAYMATIAGINISTKNRIKWNIGIGMSFQMTSTHEKDCVWYDFLELKTGIVF